MEILSPNMLEKHWSALRVIDRSVVLKILFFGNMKIVGWSFYRFDFFPFLFKKKGFSFVCLIVCFYQV